MANGHRFSALYVRDFRLFWFGQIISLSGTWMHSVAQGWLVYALSKSPLHLGIIASLSSLPILIFTLWGGIVADRYPRRNILILTQILSMFPAIIIALLTDMEIINIWHIAMTAIALGTINAFDIPARQAFLAEVVSKADITNAIALNSAAFNGARIIGPLMAGFIISTIGISACFYLNALSFIPVILALIKIKAKGVLKTYQKGIFNSVKDSWKFILKERIILYIMLLISLFSLFGIPYVTLLPVIAGEVLNKGAKEFSLLVASSGAGSFTGALIIAFKGEIKRKDIYIPLSAFAFSFAILGLSFSRNFYLSMFFIFSAGWGIVSFLATSNSLIQQIVTNELRGRIMSLYTLVFLGFAPIGNSTVGVTAHSFGTTTSLKIMATICIIGCGLFIWFVKKHSTNQNLT